MAIARRGAPARPGSIRMIASRSPKTSTSSCARTATHTLVQNAGSISGNDLRMALEVKNVPATLLPSCSDRVTRRMPARMIAAAA